MAKTKVVGKNLNRQKKLSQEMIENDGKEPMSKLMAKAGYSHSYCRNPHKLKGTENWQELMKIYLPDDLIARKHEELLNAEILLTRNVYHKLKDEEILDMFNSRGYQVVDIKRFMTNCVVSYFAPDNTNRKGALELVNKLKGTYAPEKHTIFSTGLENLSDEDLDKALEDKDFLIARFKKYGKPFIGKNNDIDPGEDTEQKELKAGNSKRRPSAGAAKRKLSGVARRNGAAGNGKQKKVAAAKRADKKGRGKNNDNIPGQDQERPDKQS